MNTSRRKLAAILEALGVPPSARRPAPTPANPSCESLEGRQLLAGNMGFGMGLASMGMGGPADFSTTGGSNTTTGDTTAAAGTTSTMDHRFARFGATSAVGSADNGQAGFDGGGTFGGPAMMDSGLAGGAGMIPMVADAGGGGLGTGGGVGFGGGGLANGINPGGPMIPVTGTGTTPGTGTASTADQAQLKTDMEKLRADSQAIHDKSQVTPAMEATVRDDIKAIKGAETTTPDQAAVTTLQADIKAARANVGGPTDAQIAQVQTDQDAVYASQGVNSALITKLDTDRAAIKTASNVTSDDESTLAADKSAIQADFAKINPPATSTTSATPDATATTVPVSIAPAVPVPTDPGSAAVSTPATDATTTTAAAPPVAVPVPTDPGSVAVSTPATDATTTTAAAPPVAVPTTSTSPTTLAPTSMPMMPATSTTMTPASMTTPMPHAIQHGHVGHVHGERGSFGRPR